jgi:hypothetical protein
MMSINNENVDPDANLISSDIGTISGTSPPKTTLISPSNNMNAAGNPHEVQQVPSRLV